MIYIALGILTGVCIATLHTLRALRLGQEKIMTTQADIDTKLAALNAKVAAETSSEKSVIALLGGISAQVADLKAQLAAANPALDLSGFDALGASIDANAAAAAAAVIANTPASAPAPAPTPDPVPPTQPDPTPAPTT